MITLEGLLLARIAVLAWKGAVKMADTLERLIALLDEVQQNGVVYTPSQMDERYGTTRAISNKEIANHLIENGVTFYVHKTENSNCFYCHSSMSGDAPDGSQVLYCFDCAGHEGKEMIVGEDEYCTNYNGIV
jgi:hypothetical protein